MKSSFLKSTQLQIGHNPIGQNLTTKWTDETIPLLIFESEARSDTITGKIRRQFLCHVLSFVKLDR